MCQAYESFGGLQAVTDHPTMWVGLGLLKEKEACKPDVTAAQRRRLLSQVRLLSCKLPVPTRHAPTYCKPWATSESKVNLFQSLPVLHLTSSSAGTPFSEQNSRDDIMCDAQQSASSNATGRAFMTPQGVRYVRPRSPPFSHSRRGIVAAPRRSSGRVSCARQTIRVRVWSCIYFM